MDGQTRGLLSSTYIVVDGLEELRINWVSLTMQWKTSSLDIKGILKVKLDFLNKYTKLDPWNPDFRNEKDYNQTLSLMS